MNVKKLIQSNKHICKLLSYPIIKIYKLKNSRLRYKLCNEGKKLEKFKNIHNQKRCFIIGNGPSLNVEDLNLLGLNKEITFGTNRIFNIFDKTAWRPTYYCIQDFVLINNIKDKINKVECKEKFIAINAKWAYNLDFNDVNYFYLNTERYYPNLPKFSEDISEQIYEGFTVTYGAIQLAIYMGFKEIYLLGVDHNYSIHINNKGEKIKDEKVKDYFSNDSNKDMNLPNLENSTLAYMKAREYCDKNNIKIYNATRGGKLDVFERIDFENVIK